MRGPLFSGTGLEAAMLPLMAATVSWMLCEDAENAAGWEHLPAGRRQWCTAVAQYRQSWFKCCRSCRFYLEDCTCATYVTEVQRCTGQEEYAACEH